MNFEAPIVAATGLTDHLWKRILRRKGMEERSIRSLDRKLNLVMICLFAIALIAVTIIMS
jgi:hypothetical protein